MFHRSVYRTVVNNNTRSFSCSANRMARLRIGYVPEHFSTPLAFARQHFNLDAELIPIPTGTGDLVKGLKATEGEEKLDVAIGLTEGFIADLGKSKAAGTEPGFGLVGTYVESPLRWAISTGANRQDVQSVDDLKGGKVGVSRIGSGSYVMSYVLADQRNWLTPSTKPFTVVPAGKFDALRAAVKDSSADFFMWEHFTTKHFWDNGELKRIGEIYTPWPSWMITARDPTNPKLQDMAEKINKGVKYYQDNREEAIEHITTTMQYSREDAEAWMKTVEFTQDVRGVDTKVVDDTIRILQKAGVLSEKAGSGADMAAIKRAERAKRS